MSSPQHAWLIFSQSGEGTGHVGLAGFGWDPSVSRATGGGAVSQGGWYWLISYSEGDQEWLSIEPDASGALTSVTAMQGAGVQFRVKVSGKVVSLYAADNETTPVASIEVPCAVARGKVGVGTFGKTTWFDNVSAPERLTWVESVAYTVAPTAIGQIVSKRESGAEGEGGGGSGHVDRWYFYNHIGNVANQAGAGGAPSSTFDQDAFGTLISGDWSDGYHQTTKQRDPDTGLYYFGARWYDPLTGRWISPEPMGKSGNRGQTWKDAK